MKFKDEIMMAADSGATLLENKDESPKMPDKRKQNMMW